MEKTREEVLYKYPFYQPADGYRYSIDALLVAGFVKSGKNEAKVLDIGAGSGIITLLLSKRFPEWKFSAVEIQKELHDLALENFHIHNLDVKMIEGDYRDIKGQDEYDLIVSNPPFFNQGNIPLNEQIAKARHEIAGNMESLVQQSKKLLKGGGFFYVIYPADRLGELLTYLSNSKLAPYAVKPIYPKPGMKATLVLAAARKNHRGRLKVLSPLYVGDENGIDTKEIENLYDKGVLEW